MEDQGLKVMILGLASYHSFCRDFGPETRLFWLYLPERENGRHEEAWPLGLLIGLLHLVGSGWLGVYIIDKF